MTLLRNRRPAEDTYHVVGDDEPIPEDGDVFLSIERFELEREGRALSRSGRTGIRASGETEPERLAPFLPSIDAIALELPKFTDGRAYSTARLLRERYAWEGELRAVGHVLRDQLFYLARCGFDVFELNDRLTADAALKALSDFSVTYQPAVDERLPLWRRRGARTRESVLPMAKGEP